MDVDSTQELLKVQAQNDVRFIEEAQLFKAPPKRASLPLNTRDFSKGLVDYPWGILELDAPSAWGPSRAGEGVKVLVLDTGIDRDHPNIASRFVEGRNLISETRNNVPYPYFDEAGHGTHVAGTILACLLYTSPSPRDQRGSRMPSSA